MLSPVSSSTQCIENSTGLVGGHCISVDPYYLVHKAIQVGYYPDVILSGRRVNDEIPVFIASKVVKMMVQKGIDVSKARVLLMGIAFKENCPDTRNTQVANIYKELVSYGIQVDVYDPWVSKEEVMEEYGIEMVSTLEELNVKQPQIGDHRLPNTGRKFDAVILTTAHKEFAGLHIADLLNSPSVVYDTKAVLDRKEIDSRL